MGKILIVILSTLLLIWQSPLWAASESQLAAISRVAELNGIALQCSFFDQTQRIKSEMVANLPKERELGEWFDLKTNESFLDFTDSSSVCPKEEDTFIELVDISIKQLESAFK